MTNRKTGQGRVFEFQSPWPFDEEGPPKEDVRQFQKKMRQYLNKVSSGIAEKYVTKPFHDGPTPRMTRQELQESMGWVHQYFTWIMPSREDDWTVEKILTTAEQLCLRRGIRGLVIDPWNELETLRSDGMSETEYISQCVKRIRVFARQRRVHVWIVVHPAKLRRDEKSIYPVPTLYDCSGSAHWRNKCDNGIVVWRDLSGSDTDEVQIHVQKIRFRQIGKRGMVQLYYEPACATYREFVGIQERNLPRPEPDDGDEKYL